MIEIEGVKFRLDELASYMVSRPNSLSVEMVGFTRALKFHKFNYNFKIQFLEKLDGMTFNTSQRIQ